MLSRIAAGGFRQTKGEMVMIDVLALAFVAVALSLPHSLRRPCSARNSTSIGSAAIS
jgi:hypothetical protein